MEAIDLVGDLVVYRIGVMAGSGEDSSEIWEEDPSRESNAFALVNLSCY